MHFGMMMIYMYTDDEFYPAKSDISQASTTPKARKPKSLRTGTQALRRRRGEGGEKFRFMQNKKSIKKNFVSVA